VSRLARMVARARGAQVHQPRGVILNVVGLVAEIGGLRAAVGECLFVEASDASWLELQVVGFRSGRLLAMPLGPLSGVRPGASVRLSARGAEVGVGPHLLGKVVDAFGRPLDGSATAKDEHYPLDADPPGPFTRKPVHKVFGTGVRVIDSLLTLGEGQRVGIFAGAGVGKSTLIGMICRASDADVNVIALVGERGREVNDFVRNTLGEEGLKKSVVIAVTSDQPPLLRARGAQAATAIAEYFRDQGKRVLLVMDSVTRYAMALRETALAAGEPPATKGYPPSVFAALPRLLERSGTAGGEGVISALYTVFVEGDDLSDPIADAVRGILDGHIVLSRSLAEKGHFPAVDVLQSVSRLAPELIDRGQFEMASKARDALGTYRDIQDLIQVGAYQRGSDPRIDAAVALVPAITTFLRQPVSERTPIGQSWARLAVALRG
jgi:flagellum-specific ATP synthase